MNIIIAEGFTFISFLLFQAFDSEISISRSLFTPSFTWISDTCLPHDSRNWSKDNRDVKSWIPKSLNPYFDKLDRIDRMTGARRFYQRRSSATMSKRDKKGKKDKISCNLHAYLSH